MRIAKISAGLALTTICIISCQSRLPSTPTRTSAASLKPSAAQCAVFAPYGQIGAVAIDVFLFDSLGLPAIGEALSFRLKSGSGEIVPPVATSDSSGCARGLFFTLVNDSSSLSVIEASTAVDAVLCSVKVVSAPRPVRIQFVESPATISVRPGETSSAKLSALVSDSDGKPVVGVRCNAEVVTGSAYITHISPSDELGLVSIELGFIGKGAGLIEVEASVGDNPDQFNRFGAPQSLIDRLFATDEFGRSVDRIAFETELTEKLTIEIDSEAITLAEDGFKILTVKTFHSARQIAQNVALTITSDPAGIVVTPRIRTDADGVAKIKIKSSDQRMLNLEVRSSEYGVSRNVVIDLRDDEQGSEIVEIASYDSLSLNLQVMSDQELPVSQRSIRITEAGCPQRIYMTDSDGRIVYRLTEKSSKYDEIVFATKTAGGVWRDLPVVFSGQSRLDSPVDLGRVVETPDKGK